MKRFLIVVLSVTFLIPLTGCSVKKAASIHKPKYETDLLVFGRPRSHVLMELGEPISSRDLGNSFVDTYDMTSNSKGWGIARSGGYAILDIGTFGLWELIGTPLEGWMQEDQTVTIYYDDLDNIERVNYTRN